MKLRGKTALITGGGTGIGAAITERFVAEGARVCITGRRKEKLDQEASQFSRESVITCTGDVSKHDDVKRIVSTTVRFGGKIDILVNNAASDAIGRITELDPDDWRRVLKLTLPVHSCL
jgi:NAD(P)-dependent dehydrogenase (short-subunit alcohol dehydrogenase family)